MAYFQFAGQLSVRMINQKHTGIFMMAFVSFRENDAGYCDRNPTISVGLHNKSSFFTDIKTRMVEGAL